MRISILAVGTRMQRWVYEGVDMYSKRMPGQIQIQVTEISPGIRTARGKNESAVEKEAALLLKRAESADLTIALDEAGIERSSVELAEEMRDWLDHVPRVALMIGGPDGLSDNCRRCADSTWSLSRLTLPHGLVRVVLAEQLYRAWTILQGHPYHRS